MHILEIVIIKVKILLLPITVFKFGHFFINWKTFTKVHDIIFYLQTEKCARGTKPCLVFSGEAFENDSEYKKLKNVLIGMEHAVTVEIVQYKTQS